MKYRVTLIDPTGSEYKEWEDCTNPSSQFPTATIMMCTFMDEDNCPVNLYLSTGWTLVVEGFPQ